MSYKILPTKPALTFPTLVAERVKREYESASTILEYGSGGSTAFASELAGKTIFSVESDRTWAESLKKYLEHSPATQSMPHIIYIDIGPTKEWGHPVGFERFRNFPKYQYSVWSMTEICSPDIILIDGRFRTACFVASVLSISKPTRILFDDYTERSHYHWVEKVQAPNEIVGRMAIFDIFPGYLNKFEMLTIIESSLDPR